MKYINNAKIKKYFLVIFGIVCFFIIAFEVYYQFIFFPRQIKEQNLRTAATVVEERSYFTPEEDMEMRAVYEKLMLEKYGKKINVGAENGTTENVSPRPSLIGD